MEVTSRRFLVWPSPLNGARALAWLLAALFLLNALYFVLRAASPVIQQDAWYFLDVFLRKAIDGTLGLADFFVKRKGIDHAQPLFKLVMLFEWRYFDLDFVVEALVGLLAAAASALVLRWIVMTGQRSDRADVIRYLAWTGVCALLFSLNAGAQAWTWPLVALENLGTLIALLFFVAVWHGHQHRRYLLLAVATLLLCICNDDSGLIAVIAVVLMLSLVWFRDPEQRQLPLGKTLGVIVACTVIVRIGYAFAPVVGGSSTTSLVTNVWFLFARLRDVGWWHWLLTPLVMPIFDEGTFVSKHADVWIVVQWALAILLLVAHGWFWRRVFRGHSNGQVFVAGCLMLLTYGWIAGIILGRVATLGNGYLDSPRYVLRYAVQLIALLLMWAESTGHVAPGPRRWRVVSRGLPVAGCLVLLALQVPLSVRAWRLREAYDVHYAEVAHQVDAYTKDPLRYTNCTVEIPVCGWPPAVRRKLAQLLTENRLNVFSTRVQRWHGYLPKLAPGHAASGRVHGVDDPHVMNPR